MLRCEDKSVSISSYKNASQDSELLLELTKSHHKATAILLIFMTCLLARVLLESNMLRCDNNSVSTSFSKNASQSCCLSLLNHFVVVKRQRQSC